VVGERRDVFTKRVLGEKHISGIMCENPDEPKLPPLPTPMLLFSVLLVGSGAERVRFRYSIICQDTLTRRQRSDLFRSSSPAATGYYQSKVSRGNHR